MYDPNTSPYKSAEEEAQALKELEEWNAKHCRECEVCHGWHAKYRSRVGFVICFDCEVECCRYADIRY